MTESTDQENPTASGKPQLHIPGYRFERLLGRGGMASVYLAIQESFGREVAIKVLEPGQAETESFSERFLREAKIVSRLSHPHIVTVYDAGIHEGYHYYSMEYVEGHNLKEALPELSLQDKLRIIKDVARALDFAGNKGYVHRDVKPENIMIRKADGHVVLTDFGIARGDDVTRGMTQTGRAIGTPHYMSPEQTKGLHVDPRSDIYSLGVVLFLLLSGHVPYDADSAIAVGIKHLSSPIPALPPDMRIFQGIINTCLSKNPEHRYQTAGELIAALDAIPPQAIQAIEGRSPATRPAAHATDAATLAEVDYPAATSIPGNSLSGTHSTPTTGYTPTQVTTGGQKIPRRKRRSNGLALFLSIVVLGGIGAGIWYGRAEISRIWQSLELPPLNEIVASITGESPAVVDSPGAAAIKTIPASSEAELTRTADPIHYMYEQLEADPDNAKILAQTYRARLSGEQPDPKARHLMTLMHDWFTEQLQIAFDNHDVKRARQLVEAMQVSFPRLTETARFTQIRNRLEQAESVHIYLDKAAQYLEQGAVIEPAGANALAAYRSVLQLAPEHPKALAGIKHITDIFHNRAIRHQGRGELEAALDNVKAGLTVHADDPELQAMQQQLQEAIETRSKVAALNKKGEAAFEQGNLLQPKNRSAFHYYQQALKLQADNPSASEGLQKIQQNKLLKIQFEIREKRFEQAETMLTNLESWFGKTEPIRHSWETLLSAIEDSQPKISDVAYSDLEITSLNISKPSVLKPIRNLYFGFAYKNLPQEQNRIEAYLMEKTERVAMAHKTLTLENQEGKYFDNLLLPINEMQEGRYNLVFLLNDKPLHRSSLYIDIQ
ncbi:serine/threonine protein kinase [Thiohalophilus sp.]|uniref:serine/threonine protein kinase n=1 Tax=Thiohalophilus sp. TaxID=3028392 RepID=UPI002ACEBF58|nr:protein kinase [Thiohalophilus sp.]MDZ7663382.1 protein kinase [Thiohalophilus sp.]